MRQRSDMALVRTRREPACLIRRCAGGASNNSTGNLAQADALLLTVGARAMIRKLRSGEYRLYSRKKNPETGKRRNLGTFKTLAAAKKHERAVQYFKRHG